MMAQTHGFLALQLNPFLFPIQIIPTLHVSLKGKLLALPEIFRYKKIGKEIKVWKGQ